MIFTNLNSQTSYTNRLISNPQPTPVYSILSSRHRPTPIYSGVLPTNGNPQHNVMVQSPDTRAPSTGPKKMKWGEPTWNFLHILAEKVKDEYFASIREELLDVVYTVCSNLPCPDCAEHASAYMNGINYKYIKTKEQLKNMLYSFHNAVNQKKGFPLFPRDQLEGQYRSMPLIPTINLFMYHFQDKHRSIRMIANDFHRSRMASKLKGWFQNNIEYFDA